MIAAAPPLWVRAAAPSVELFARLVDRVRPFSRLVDQVGAVGVFRCSVPHAEDFLIHARDLGIQVSAFPCLDWEQHGHAI